jgi:hypothetical protein
VLENRESRHVGVAAPSPVQSLGDELPSRQRSRRANDPLAGIDTNTAIGRRVADLLRGFMRAMGSPTDIVQQAGAIRAAELTCAAEIARSKLLAGDGDIDAVARLEGVARRAVADLRLPAAQREPAEQSLAAYLQSRYGGQDDSEPDDEDYADAHDDAEAAADSEPQAHENEHDATGVAAAGEVTATVSL